MTKRKKHVLKKTLSSVLAVVTISGLIPAAKYHTARKIMPFDAKSIVDYDTADKTQKVCEIFADGINGNKNLPKEYKEIIIEAFTDLFLEQNGQYLTEEAIINMWAVARTEKVEELSEFILEHGWWYGDYNPFTNKYTFDNTAHKALIAHEQLHAILKHGSFGTGLTNFLLGYSLNEGLTSLSIEGEQYSDTYNHEQWQANYFSLIIGLEKVYGFYINHDLSSLLKEMSKYLTLYESLELLALMDINIFSGYFQTFLSKNSMLSAKMQNSLENNELKSNTRIRELLKKLYLNKNGNIVDNFGELIFNSAYFNSDDYNPGEIFYEINLLSPEVVEINFFHDVLVSYSDGFTWTCLTKSFTFKSNEIQNIKIEDLMPQVYKSFEEQKNKYKSEGGTIKEFYMEENSNTLK